MPTALELELLQRSMEGLGNAFQKNRQIGIEADLARRRLDFEQQRESTQTARYNAQQAHFERMEDAQADTAAKAGKREDDRNELLKKQIDAAEKKVGLQQAAKDMADATQRLQSGLPMLGKLVREGDMDQGTALEYFKNSMDAFPQAMRDKMLAEHPEFSAMYNGDVPFEKVGMSPQPNILNLPGGGQIAVDPKTGHPTNVRKPNKAPIKVAEERITHGSRRVTDPNTQAVTYEPYSTTNTVRSVYANLPGQPDGTATSPSRQSMISQAPAPTVPDPAAILRQAPSAAASPQSPSATTPGQQHIDYLLSHPEMAPWFDAKFGPGSSAKYLQTPSATQQ